MYEEIAAFEGRIAKICGPAASGKTEALVCRIVALAQRGVKPETILVGTTSSAAAEEFRLRLRRALARGDEDFADDVSILTPLQACARVLERDCTKRATGRIPRFLTQGEYAFFLEDMKTLGQPVRRLRAMLAFFFERWSMLEDEESWLEPGEESRARAHMARLLEGYGAMLTQEAAFVCARYLQSDQGADDRGLYDYVLCDDYQNMSRAEQSSLCMMARRQLIVAGNADEQIGGADSHPFAQGFDDFEKLRFDVRTFELERSLCAPGAAAFSQALLPGNRAPECDAKRPMPCSDDVACIKWDSPEDELEGIAALVSHRLASLPDGVRASLCIAVPNCRWARMMGSALSRRGVDAAFGPSLGGIRGDYRDSERCQALKALVGISLLADESDVVAWRCWCGMGNHIANSDAWAQLVSYADCRGESLLDALASLAPCALEGASEPFARARVLAERFVKGRAFIEKNAGRCGFAVLHAAGAQNLIEFRDFSASLEGDESASDIGRALRAWAICPHYPHAAYDVRVATYADMAGLSFDEVYAVALVDGLMPDRDAFEVVSTDEARTRVMDSQRRVLLCAAAKARRRLVLSYFSRASLEMAERARMQVTRVRAEGAGRVAVLRKSCFLSEAAAALPSVAGGQAELARYGLN